VSSSVSQIRQDATKALDATLALKAEVEAAGGKMSRAELERALEALKAVQDDAARVSKAIDELEAARIASDA
jgi:ABC-type branched-subunit amino acid transport system substrate-binding protein